MGLLILSYLCVVLLHHLVSCTPVPSYFASRVSTPTNLTSSKVARDLGARLSEGSTITGPHDEAYIKQTQRWNVYAVPRVQVVVQPASEDDVAIIVKYCNQNSIEFMAYSRGHGYPTSLTSFTGLQINLADLSTITIQNDKKTALVQGGAFDGKIVDSLWEQGYVTTTGSCACVGIGGAGLGGGHGILEGLYGLISDNFVELKVVLGDGSIVIANDRNQYEDLFWAMRGAGHNFGIVTSLQMRIYPRGPPVWFYKKYTWTSDKLELVFTAMNKLHQNANTPVNMAANFGTFRVNSTIDATAPVIYWTFAFRGTAKGARKYMAPFDAIEAADVQSGEIPYPQVSHSQEVGLEDPSCGHDVVRITSNANSMVYNLTAENLIIEAYKLRMKLQPVVAASSIAIHEGFANKAVQEVDAASSAYPWRDSRHLLYFQGLLGPDSPLLNDVIHFSREIQDIWNAGQPTRRSEVYVNYANGNETLEEMYGYEAWRLSKLRKLKRKYDPTNRFRYYNPIIKGAA